MHIYIIIHATVTDCIQASNKSQLESDKLLLQPGYTQCLCYEGFRYTFISVQGNIINQVWQVPANLAPKKSGTGKGK